MTSSSYAAFHFSYWLEYQEEGEENGLKNLDRNQVVVQTECAGLIFNINAGNVSVHNKFEE